MNNAKSILLLIGGIISIIAAIGIIVTGLVTIVLASPAFASFLEEAIESGSITTDIPDLDALRLFLTIIGTSIMFMAVLPVACAIISFVAKNKDSKGLYVACIVFGFLSGGYLSLIGGVIGVLDTSNG